MKKSSKSAYSRLSRFTPFTLFALLVLLAFFAGANRDTIGAFIISRISIVMPQTGDTVSALALKAMLKDKKMTLINVHVPYEGEIAGTDTFVAYDKMVEQSAFLPKDKNAPIILYCKTGRMSTEAIQTMRSMGYTNVRHLSGGMDAWQRSGGKLLDLSTLEESVLPKEGIELPISWGTLGKQLVDAGVIDFIEFSKVVNMTPEQEKILKEGSDEKIRIDSTNGQFVVDVLWALGLAQKSIVYEEGPMGKEEKANAGNFASTGGWTLARGDAMQYLNRFDFIALTPEQQKKVGEIAKNVYRPCCGNPTWFPDCNHGMAALAAIEMMVASGISEKEIYKGVLALNSFWFANTYLTTATYFARQGTAWSDVDAKMVLGRDYSSSQGASAIAKKVGSLPYKPTQSGGACGA